ncbi:MAG: hypothetical protein ACJ8BF_03010 [Gemmatimonadales bacterium]
MLLLLMAALQIASSDTLVIRTVNRPPVPGVPVDSARYGAPQVRIITRQGSAPIWLLRASDTIFIAAGIPDTTPYWGDDFVLSLDTRGDGAPHPQHDDFQLYFRRVLDSSVVFRGQDGRWQPPRGDPDWRLGADRSGGGWEVSATSGPRGWSILVRLDPAWFAGEKGRLARIAFRIYGDSPSGWFSWPLPLGKAPARTVEETPAMWIPVR